MKTKAWLLFGAALLLAAPRAFAEEVEGEAAPQGVLTRPPELLQFVEATYPPQAMAAGTTGSVLMLLTIDEAGKVTEVIVQEPAGNGFDEAAVVAVKQFTFRPAEVDNAPAPVQIAYRYEFTLETQVETVEAPVDKDNPTGELRGRLLERGTRAPLLGLNVRLGERATLSNERGEFVFDKVPVGEVKIIIDDQDYYTLEDEEEIRLGEITEVRYYLEKRSVGDQTVVVVGKRVRKEVARRTLTMEEIRKIPGTNGDALKVVQNLPGVARVPFGGDLIVRGSNPGDSSPVINRHGIPVAYHFGGLRSVFPSELLESIDFYPGNYGAEYGRYSGGIIDVKIRRPKEDRLHGRVEADFFDAGVLLEGPLPLIDGATFAVAARRSYIDLLLNAVIPEDAPISFDVAPRYYDQQVLLDWKKKGHRLRFYYFGSNDRLELVLKEASARDPSVGGDIENEIGFHRFYAAWDARLSEDVEHHFSVSFGPNHLYFAAFDQLYFNQDIWVFLIRDDISWQVNDTFKLRAGLDLELYSGDIRIIAPFPPKEGEDPAPLGTMELMEVNESIFVQDPGAWLEAEIKLFDDKLLIVPGLRIDYNRTLEDWAFDPRLNARYTLRKGTVIKGGAGWYNQRPFFDESDETFGNPNLEQEQSFQVSGGVEQALTGLSEGLELDVVGFYKHLYDSVAPVEDPAIRYENIGTGRIYGLEVLLRQNLTRRFFGWISYTAMRSERKDGPDEDWRLFDFDQTHIFTALGTYKLTNNWEVGLRWRYTTGNPYTPKNKCIYDSDNDTCIAYNLPANSERIPPFHQLDLRVERRWIFDLWILSGYLDLQNAYNRENPEGVGYNEDYTQQEIRSGLPIIPSLGFRGEF
ncbi:TonB family protein [Myxococcota bacterium]|nr:TonB family protein [Myxococcota bacterium]